MMPLNLKVFEGIQNCLKKLSVFRSVFKAATSLILMLVIIACASKYPEAPMDVSGDPSSSYDYLIGEGDVLNIFVWGYDELSDSVAVRPDGQITTRLVEDLTAAGKTTSVLAREIELKYSDFVKRPVVSVSVGQFVGIRAQQVKIVGAGTQPKTVPFTRGMALLDVIIEVGGIEEYAAGNKATLVRREGEENVNYSLRIDDLIRSGDVSANVPLLPGDTIIIPESRF